MRANAIAFMPATPRSAASPTTPRGCAKANQIVILRRVFGMVEPWVDGNSLEELNLKGFNHPVLAVEILRWREEREDVEAAAAEAPRRRQQPS